MNVVVPKTEFQTLVGDQTITGGAGYNTVIFNGKPSDYAVSDRDVDGAFSVTARDGTASSAAGYGTYTLSNIQAIGYKVWNDRTNKYDIFLEQLDEASDFTSSELNNNAQAVNIAGGIDYATDVDYYRIDIANPGTYYIDRSGNNSNVQIVNESGYGTGTNPNEFTITDAGTYYLKVWGSTGGYYTFNVRGKVTNVTASADDVTLNDQYQWVQAGNGDDIIRGSVHDDKMWGQDGWDIFYSGGGADFIDGGGGYNFLAVDGAREDYTITADGSNDLSITHKNGTVIDARGINEVIYLDGASIALNTSTSTKLYEVTLGDGTVVTSSEFTTERAALLSLDTQVVDSFPDNRDTHPDNPVYGFGDVIRIAADPGSTGWIWHEQVDWIQFDLPKWEIDDTTQFLLIVDRAGPTDGPKYQDIYIYNEKGQTLYFRDQSLISSSGDASIQSNYLNFSAWSGSHYEMVFTGGYWDNVETSSTRFDGGTVWLYSAQQLSGNIGEVSYTLYQYESLTDGDDIVNYKTGEGVSVNEINGLYIQGGAGDDQITGNVFDEVFDGGAGADTLIGGDGNDQFIINSNSAGDTIDGGTHATTGIGDALKLATSYDLSSLSFTNIESLIGASTNVVATLTEGQFNSLTNFDGLSVRVTEGSSITLGSKNFLNGAQVSGSGIAVTAGNAAANEVTFTGGDNTYTGGDGAEKVTSGSGDDRLTMGAGNDTVIDAGGDNTISMGDGKDYLKINLGGDNDISMGAGDDKLYVASASDVGSWSAGLIKGDAGTDILELGGTGIFDFTSVGITGFETLRGYSGASIAYLTGSQAAGFTSFDNVKVALSDGAVLALDGKQLLNGASLTASDATITYTGTSSFTITLTDGDSDISLGAGADVITSGSGDDTITTNDGDDRIILNGGINTVSAGAGNDYVQLTPQLLNGSIHLGAGDDTLKFAGLLEVGASGTITGGDGSDTLILGSYGDYSGFDITGVETIQLTGSGVYIFDGDFLETLPEGTITSGDGVIIKSRLLVDPATDLSTITLDDNVASVELVSAGSLDGSTVSDWSGALTGSSGADTITAVAGLGSISGRAGDDIITGSPGSDVIYGDRGDDQINSLDGDDLVYGGLGNDVITTGAGSSVVHGGDGSDTITSGSGGNTIHGNAGDDQITSGTGADTIYGDVGADTIYAGGGDDVIWGGGGDDIITIGINPEDDHDFGPDGFSTTVYGGAGLNTVKVYGAPSDYERSTVDENGTFTLTAREGTASYELGARTYTLTNIQKLIHLVKDNTLGTYVERVYRIDDLPDLRSPSQEALSLGETQNFYAQYDNDVDYQRLVIEEAGAYRLFGYGNIPHFGVSLEDEAGNSLGSFYNHISYLWTNSDYLSQNIDHGLVDLTAGEYYLKTQASAGEYFNAQLVYQYEQVTGGADIINLTVDGSFVRAGGGADSIHGSSGNDLIFAEAGDDIIYSGGGSDFIDGGPGYNILYVDGDASNYTFSAKPEYFTSWQRDSQLKITGVDGGVINLININEVRFVDETLVLDSFADEPGSSTSTPTFGYGDVVRFESGPPNPDDARYSYLADADYIKFQLDEWNIPEDAKFLLSIDRAFYNEADWHGYMTIQFVNSSGSALTFESSEILSGTNINLSSNSFSTQYWSDHHFEIVFDPGYFNNQQIEQNKFGGEVFLALTNKNGVQSGAVSLYQYRDFTDQDDEVVIVDPGFDSLYVAGLGGNDVITGSLRSEIIDGGAGQDTLYGMAGDDQFIINANSLTDTIDGGGHRVVLSDGTVSNNGTTGELEGLGDSLKLQTSVDLTNLNFTGIESLVGSSTSTIATLTADQFNSLYNFDGLSVRVTEGSSITLGSKNFLNDAQVLGSGITVTAGNAATNKVTFTGGDNTYTGGDGAEIVTSGSGDDRLTMGAGNDTVIDAGGDNIISMGDGKDYLTLSQIKAGENIVDLGAKDDVLRFDAAVSVSSSGTIEGGTGTDTLVLEYGSSDLSNLSFSGFEILKIDKFGVYTFAEGDLAQFTSVEYGAGASKSFLLEKTSTPFTATTGDFSGHGEAIGVSGSEQTDYLIGTSYNDLLVGNGGNDNLRGGDGIDTIFGGKGDDYLDGGAGGDHIYPEAGADIVVAGDGSDSIYLGPENVVRGKTDSWDYDGFRNFIGGTSYWANTNWWHANTVRNREYTFGFDDIDAGAGNDTLYIDTGRGDETRFEFNSNLRGIENIVIDQNGNGYGNTFIFDGDVFEGLTSFSTGRLAPDDHYYYVLSNNNNLDFSVLKYSAKGGVVFRVLGDVDELRTGNQVFYDSWSDDAFWFENVNKFINTGTNFISRTPDLEFNYQGSSGTDQLRITSSGNVKINFDGRDGTDTLIFDQSVDISESAITNTEEIVANGSSIVLTQAQYDSLNISGSAAKFIKKEYFIEGSTAEDSFTGTGFEKVLGGAGNDNISQVHSVYFSGNHSDYQYEASQSFSVTHIGGTAADGTDTLSFVQSLWFPNISGGFDEVVIDDFTNQYGSVSEMFARAQLYGGLLDYQNRSLTGEKKVDSGVINYSGDTDLFYAELVSSSPIDVQVGATNGWSTQWWDAATGQNLSFWSPVTNWFAGGFESWMSNRKDLLWTPVIYQNNKWEKYEGGDVVLSLSVNSTGDYTIGLQLYDDYSAATTTLGKLDPEKGYVTGYIGDEDATGAVVDRDWIAIDLVKGTTYEIEVIGLGGKGGTLKDPHLRILNDAGAMVLHEEDGFLVGTQVGNDVYTEFNADYTGLHYLEVSSGTEWDGVDLDEVGSWTLKVRSKDQYSADVNTTGRIELDTSNLGFAESEINELGDRDWFKVYLEKGLTYKIEALGQSSGSGSLDDPEVEIRSPIGLKIKGDDDSGLNDDASLDFAPTVSGYYFVGVAGSGNNSKGTFKVRVSSVPDDYAGDKSTTGILRVGQLKTGELQIANDSDWFKIALTKGDYIFKVFADPSGDLDPVRDPYAILRDASGAPIIWSDDSRDSLDSEFYFKVNEDTAGAYFLDVQGGFKYDIGAYGILVDFAPADEFADKISGDTKPLGSLTLGLDTLGTIQVPGDLDVFAAIVSKGTTYRFDVKGFAGIASQPYAVPSDDLLPDPIMRLFNSKGQLLFSADDGGLGADAREYFTASDNETVYLMVGSSNPKDLGEYKVSYAALDRPGDDFGNTAATAYSISAGDVISGELLMRNDIDMFKINLNEGDRYVFHLRGYGTGEGTLVDPYLTLRTGENGAHVVAENDNSGWYENALISYVAPHTGTFYLEVKADQPQAGEEIGTGTYTLITREPDDHGDTSVNATALLLDSSVAGRINYNDGIFGAAALNSYARATDTDLDWFKLTLEAGDVVTLEVDASAEGSTSRPMFEVVDGSSSALVARGDGKESGNIASSAFKAVNGGDYFIAITDGAGGIGNYVVSAKSGDVADEDFNLPSLSLGTFNAKNSIIKTGIIGIAGDDDTYSYSLENGHTYRLSVRGAHDGTTAPLENIHVDADWLTAEQSLPQLDGSFTVSDVGDGISNTHYFTIAAADGLSTGRYVVELVDLGTLGGDDFADTISDYDKFSNDGYAIGETIQGTIEESGDLDLVQLTLTQGQRYEMVALGFQDDAGTLAVPELALLNENGVVVSSGFTDLDAGRSTLETSVFASGTYYLQTAAKAFEGNLGSYTINTSRVAVGDGQSDDVPENTSTGFTVAKGQPITSQIDFEGDVDWFKASLEKDKVYKIDVLADGAGYGTLTNSKLRVISPNGVQVGFDNNSGAGNDSELVLTAAETGNFYFEVAADYRETGSYQLRLRELYSGIEDPLAAQQFYLEKLGIYELRDQYSGAGIVVGVIDDGIEYAHPDLMNQIDYAGDSDSQFKTELAFHKYPNIIPFPPDMHGTPVAGIIAAEQGNETGVVGIAPDAKIAATRVKWAMTHMIDALQKQVQFDVSNNSWGATKIFADDFNKADWMMGYQGIKYAVENGRESKGTVFVFSAGNSRASGDNVNYHNFQNARETITVAATEADGTVASFSTPGAAILVGAYGVDLLTTDRLGVLGYNISITGDYVEFTGTSAAAPVVSGVVSLMLEANPNLGYRDVQKILAYTAWHPTTDTAWSVNNSQDVNLGGLKFNDDLGFGVVDARAAVRLSETWSDFSNARNEIRVGDRQLSLHDEIPDEGVPLVYQFNIDTHLAIEHAVLSVDIAHPRLGDLELDLISPDGTVSRLIDRPTVTEGRPFGLYGEYSETPGRIIFDLSSVQYLGEDAYGEWKVQISDVRAEYVGLVRGLSLNVYGSSIDDDNQFIFTDEFVAAGSLAEIRDDQGYDIINGSALSKALFVDLSAKEGAIDALYVDGFWEGGERFTISDWTKIEAVYGGDGNDQLLGDEFNNTLKGGLGDDILFGGLGSDIFYGGGGTDCVIYDVNYEALQQNITYSALDRCVTISGGAGSTAWVDKLFQVEELIFNDIKVYLDDLFSLNSAPVVNTEVLNAPIRIGNGQTLSLEIPSDAFSDPDQAAYDLALSLSLIDENGDVVELPDWLKFNPKTGLLEGEPSQDNVGRYRLLLTAKDEFGAEANKEISIEVGDNRAPIVENPRTLSLDEDVEDTLLAITMPTDPDKDDMVVKIVETPGQGLILLGSGAEVKVGDELSIDQLTGLVYRSAKNFGGDAGTFKYSVVDARNVASTTSIDFEINAINDAPEFGPDNQLTLVYSGEALNIDLSLPVPIDAEQSIETVKISALPIFGQLVLLNIENEEVQLSVGDTLAVSNLINVRFKFDQSVNGPIGSVGLEATDKVGAKGNWSIELFVNGDLTIATGTMYDDQLYGSVAADQLFGLSGDDLLFGNAGGDRIYAGSGADHVYGGSGGDIIDGGNGNDYLDGGEGDDIISGGLGDDVYIVDSAGDMVLEGVSSKSGGFDTIRTTISLALPENVEALEALGGENLSLAGNHLDNIILGNSGDNIISGGDGSDVLVGDNGNDILDGGNGRDQLLGGYGDDIYYVDSRSDIVTEAFNQGIDTVYSTQTYVLSSNVENLILIGTGDISAGGNSLNNHIVGNDGANLINGGLGADLMEGGLGDDTYVIDSKADRIIDTGGIDTVKTSINILTLDENIENIIAIGIEDLVLSGNQSENIIIGNSGSNTIDGGAGADKLTGGLGPDVFIASSVDQLADYITDFVVGEDLIAIDAISIGLIEIDEIDNSWLLNEGFKPKHFVSGQNQVATTSDHHFIYDEARNVLAVDLDGVGGQEQFDIFEFNGSNKQILDYNSLLVVL